MTEQPQIPAAGWYPNPEGQGLRYWDGSQWTEHRHAPTGPKESTGGLTISVGVLLAGIGAALAIGGTFLPLADVQASIHIASNSMIQHTEGIAIVVLALIALFAAIENRPWLGILGGLAILGVAFYVGTNISDLISPNAALSGLLENTAGTEAGEQLSEATNATPGAGVWACGIGGTLLTLAGSQTQPPAEAEP